MATVEERAHDSFCDWSRWKGLLDPDGATLDECGIIVSAGSIDFPSSRSAIRSDFSLTAEQWSEKVDAFFAAHGNTGCVHARIDADDDLTARFLDRGFREWTTLPEMVCDHVLEPRDAPAGVTVRFASSADDISAYARVAAEAFGHLMLPEEATISAVDRPAVRTSPITAPWRSRSSTASRSWGRTCCCVTRTVAATSPGCRARTRHAAEVSATR